VPAVNVCIIDKLLLGQVCVLPLHVAEGYPVGP
jgi:hypothetical protein